MTEETNNSLQVRPQAITLPNDPAEQSRALVAGVMAAASDPSVDVTKMERLWVIAKEAQATQAKREYADAMKAVQSELPKIVRDRENKQTNSSYATLDNIIRQIAPIYTKHGFSLSFDSADTSLEKCIRVVCTVMHSGGHTERFQYDQPIDDAGIQGAINKTQTHARGSAMTYGRRYLTLMVFNINTGFDDDGNSATSGNKPITEVDTAFIARAEACEHPKEASDLRTEVIKHYGSSTKVPPAVMAAINAARDSTRPKD